mmetsp:Transcript_20106/g.54157  ORF Transcript_20106/g.54157 Transcript_20106/m.54157 type:complete len:372 (+) Transcript_20106:730-1845(+)
MPSSAKMRGGTVRRRKASSSTKRQWNCDGDASPSSIRGALGFSNREVERGLGVAVCDVWSSQLDEAEARATCSFAACAAEAMDALCASSCAGAGGASICTAPVSAREDLFIPFGVLAACESPPATSPSIAPSASAPTVAAWARALRRCTSKPEASRMPPAGESLSMRCMLVSSSRLGAAELVSWGVVSTLSWRMMEKVTPLPRPADVRRSCEPSWRLSMERVILRPRPVPPLACSCPCPTCRKGCESLSVASSSSVRPIPVSLTSTTSVDHRSGGSETSGCMSPVAAVTSEAAVALSRPAPGAVLANSSSLARRGENASAWLPRAWPWRCRVSDWSAPSTKSPTSSRTDTVTDPPRSVNLMALLTPLLRHC